MVVTVLVEWCVMFVVVVVKVKGEAVTEAKLLLCCVWGGDVSVSNP